jgi:putative ABC transport system permease protein
MEAALLDVRLALRRLRLAPGFTLFAIVSLALGIGVSTAVYSAVHTLFWLPMGVPQQDELVAITSGRLTNMTGLDFQDVRAQQSTFQALAASTRLRTALASTEGAEVVLGEAVSGDYFTVLQLGALRGRLLAPLDERESSRVVVLSERFWRQHMRADPAAVGRTVRLGGLPFEVVGIIRGSFHGLDRYATRSVWIPVGAIPATARAAFDVFGDLTMRQRAVFAVWGRLRPGVPAARAASEVQVIGQRLDAAYPRGKDQPRQFAIRERAATPAQSDAVKTLAGMIMTGVGVLLLVACSNLANLALAKGTSRSEETAVRSALGASRWRLVREQLIESAIIVAAGGALGVVVLDRLVDFFTVDLPMGRGQTMPLHPEVNLEVLAGSAVSLLLALLVCGLWPALQATTSNVRAGFGSGLAATPPKWRLHRTLVAWQVCGCVALLLVAAMAHSVISGFGGGGTLAPAVDRRLAIAQIDFALNARDEAQTRRLVETLLASLRAQPGIERATVSNGLPVGSMFATMRPDGVVTTEDRPFNAARDTGRSASVIAVGPELFDTVGVRIRRGRGFTDRDDIVAPRVAVISERLARDVVQSVDVVGRTLLLGVSARLSPRGPAPETLTVVGVSADLDEPTGTYRGDALVFVPWAQRYEPRVPVLVTVRGPSWAAAAGILRATIRRLDPDLAASTVGTGTMLLQGPVFIFRIIRGLATALASMSMVLAMAGLFGVLSHVVLRRMREMGIRIALGADRGQIFRLVLFDGMRPVAKGIVLGLMIGVGARLAVRSWVVTNVSAFESIVLAVVPIPFVVAALVACYLPAARASRVDPNVALRDL